MNKSDQEFIKEFVEISIANICRELKIDRANISSGSASRQNFKKVRKELVNQILNLFKDNSDE